MFDVRVLLITKEQVKYIVYIVSHNTWCASSSTFLGI